MIPTLEEFMIISEKYSNIKDSGVDGVGNISYGDFINCVSWLTNESNILPASSYCIGSYGLKHVIEKDIGDYIPNGAVILAGYYLNISQKTNSLLGPNTRLKLKYTRETKERFNIGVRARYKNRKLGIF